MRSASGGSRRACAWNGSTWAAAGGTATFSSRNDKALPSLNIAYLLTPQLTVFGNYTTSFGPVQNIQLNSQTASNPLNPEVAKTTELGARWQDGALRAEVTVFKMRFDNQILQVPGITPPTFQNIGATDHKGVESALEYHFAEDGALAGLELYANYTWTKAIQQSGDNRVWTCRSTRATPTASAPATRWPAGPSTSPAPTRAASSPTPPTPGPRALTRAWDACRAYACGMPKWPAGAGAG